MDAPSVKMLPLYDFIKCQAQTLPIQSPQADLSILPQLFSASIEVASNKGLMKHLEHLFKDKSPDQGLVNQHELEFLTKKKLERKG